MAQSKTPSDKLNKGTDESTGLQAELFVNDRAEAMIKYSQPFDQELSWLEYDLDSSKLDFVMEDGDIRNFGIPVEPGLAKYLQNAPAVTSRKVPLIPPKSIVINKTMT